MKAHRLVTWSAGVFLVLIVSGAHGDEPSSDEPKAVFRTADVYASCVAFSPDGKLIAVACESGNARQSGHVELWEVCSGKRKSSVQGHSGWVSSVAFSGDGKLLASAGEKDTILWDVATAQPKAVLKGQTSALNCLAFGGGGKLLAAGGNDESIIMWDVAMTKVKATLTGRSKPTTNDSGCACTSIAFSGDGKLLAAASSGGFIRLWDLATGKLKATLDGSSDEGLSSVAFSPDGKLLAVGSLNSIVKVWCVATGKVKAVLKGKGGPYYSCAMPVSSLAFSPDGKWLATVGGRGLDLDEWEEPPAPVFQIILWDVASWQEKANVCGETGQMFSVAFSPDSKLLATGDCHDLAFLDGPGAVRLWEIQAILKDGK
jgi:WD40 repeat protein